MQTIAAVILVLPGHARAGADTPAYIRHAWRERLVTMAPICGLRPADWGAQASHAIRLDTYNSLSQASDDANDAADGALQEAQVIGKNMPKIAGGIFCKLLARDLALKNTEDLIAIFPLKSGQTGEVDEPEQLPVTVRHKASMALVPAMDVACGMYSDDWQTQRLADVLGEVHESVDIKLPSDQRRRIESEGTGAALMAEFAGERIVAVDRSAVCNSISKPAQQRDVDELLRDHSRLNKEMLDAIATPDD